MQYVRKHACTLQVTVNLQSKATQKLAPQDNTLPTSQQDTSQSVNKTAYKCASLPALNSYVFN